MIPYNPENLWAEERRRGLKKNETHRPDVNDLHAQLKQLTLLQSPAASYHHPEADIVGCAWHE